MGLKNEYALVDVSLLEGIRMRNAAKWLSLPQYVAYHDFQYLREQPGAIVLDIDRTILDEFSCKIMPNCLEALEKVAIMNWHVFLVTARPESTRTRTMEQLEANGIHDGLYEELLMRAEDAVDYKSKRQQRFGIRDFYSLEIAVGDMPHDLIGADECDDTPFSNILMESLQCS